MCELKHTKPAPLAADFEQIVDRIEDLVSERDAGFPIDRGRISLLEAEGVIAWTRIEKMRELMERQALLAALTGSARVGA